MPRLSSQHARPLLAGFAGFVALSTTVLAGSPRLTHIYPAGVPRGGEMEISLSGTNIGDARELLFDTPGFTVSALEPVKGAEKTRVKAKIKVAGDARLGEHFVRLVTRSGISDVRLLYVSPFPVVEEAPEDKVDPAKPQPVPLGVTVYGRTQNEDQDRFAVDLKKGQRLSAEVIGVRTQTQNVYDPYLTITKADGTAIVEVDDGAFTQQDPVASILAPEDGTYFVMVKDSTNTGSGECAYLINIGSFPRPLAVYPAGGPAGESLKVKLVGDPAGPIETTVRLPDREDDRFEVFADQGQPAPQPNLIRVSKSLNALETEPNNESAAANVVTIAPPVALNGIIETPGDVDFFKFTAKKGQDYDVTVWARRLRSPLDSVIEIFNAKGARLALNDDGGNSDSYLRWKAPEDGEHFLSVRDQLNHGGPTFVYRVELNPVQPRITTWLPEMDLNQNQTRRSISVPKGNRTASLVRIKRMDVGGEVVFEPKDLPAGVTVHAGPIDKSVDTIPVVFEAAPDAAPAARAFDLVAKISNPPEAAQTPSEINHTVDISENGNQRPYYTIRESTLPIAVTDEIPVKITVDQPKVPILQNGSARLTVRAERKNDFKGPINLVLLYAPPGIGTAGTTQIPEGQNESTITISANGNAQLAKWKICVAGNADFGNGPTWMSTQLVDLEVAPPFVSGQIVRSFLDQGDSTNITVKLEPKVEFAGKAKITLTGLPPGVTAEEKEITKDDKEVKIGIKATAEAQVGQHKQVFATFTLEKDGEKMLTNFAQGGILRVDKATVAKNEEPKK